VIYARRAAAELKRDSVRQAALEAIQTAEDSTDPATGNKEHDVLRWLETELTDVWARAEGGSLPRLNTGQERRRGDLLEEITPGVTGAVLLTRSLVGGCSSRTAMVRQCDVRWNQIEASLVLMYTKMRDLGFRYDGQEVVIPVDEVGSDV
jgi:hypothetical protein